MTLLRHMRTKDNKDELRKAYTIWLGQKKRCSDEKNKRFRWYGAKGISVEYSLEEFTRWWLENKPKDAKARINVGRIDHSKNYRLDNIEFQSASENSKEANQRNLIKRIKGVLCFDYETKEPLMLFSSLKQAAEITGIHNVSSICHGKRRQENGISFIFLEGAISLSTIYKI